MSANGPNLVNIETITSPGGQLLVSQNGVNPVSFGKRWYVNTVLGNDAYDGQSPSFPFRTMAKAFSKLSSRDEIVFVGKVKEQLVAPLGVYGVTIRGGDTRPRHDLAASWTIPTVAAAATPLLRLREQGWVLLNFLMYGITDAAAVMLKRREDTTDPDASHAQFLGLRFASCYIGIEDNGGCFNVLVDGCTFESSTNHAIKNTSTTIANPLEWTIQNNRFVGNVNGIVSPFSKARILNNTFTNTTTVKINLTGGVASNIVTGNTFDIAAADFDPAGGVTGVTGDAWSNTLTDAIETGLPAN